MELLLPRMNNFDHQDQDGKNAYMWGLSALHNKYRPQNTNEHCAKLVSLIALKTNFYLMQSQHFA